MNPALLLTGAAGFIGYHVAEALLAQGWQVIGVDNLTPYYDIRLKQARLDRLSIHSGFTFERLNIADSTAMEQLRARYPDTEYVIHLAAQPGVRYSVENPFAYVESNLVGHMAVLELCRYLPKLRHLVYASSSSVYGGNTKLPFAEDDLVDAPRSLYAATKKADELLTHSYSHLYNIPATGLRFFTVYGPWGRPDMAPWLFTEAISQGKPITVYNNGDMQRDFTYIDDIVQGVLGGLNVIPQGEAPHTVYNLGHHHPEPLLRFIALIEQALGKKAEMVFAPMHPGDVPATYADISRAQAAFGFTPATPIEVGVPAFVEWYNYFTTTS